MVVVVVVVVAVVVVFVVVVDVDDDDDCRYSYRLFWDYSCCELHVGMVEVWDFLVGIF